MGNDITNRFLEAIDCLIETGKTPNKRAISAAIGVSNSLLTDISKGRSNVGVQPIRNIVQEYGVSASWLLTGEGEMLKSEQPAVPVAIPCDPANDKLGIPLIPVEAMAGIAQGEVQVLEYECERYVVPMFRDAEFLIPVKGSSMIPKYNSGDIVACKSLPLTDLFFQWNKVYVLDTIQGALIKRVKAGSDSEHVLIVSDNQNYPPFELHLNQIRAVALVVGVIRLE